MKPMRISDIILAFPAALVLLAIALGVTCSGWNEGTMHGTCRIDLLEPVYDTVMGALLGLAFSGIFWAPAFLVLYVLSTKDKVQLLMTGGFRGLFENPLGTIIWMIATVPLLYILFIIIASLFPLV